MAKTDEPAFTVQKTTQHLLLLTSLQERHDELDYSARHQMYKDLKWDETAAETMAKAVLEMAPGCTGTDADSLSSEFKKANARYAGDK